jgi:NhaB family Na+:H+ antiporter
MPERVRQVLAAYAAEDDAARTRRNASPWWCRLAALILIVCLGLHIAEVG